MLKITFSIFYDLYIKIVSSSQKVKGKYKILFIYNQQMSSGLPQGLQKHMLTTSSLGLAFTDFLQFILSIIYFIWGTKYDGFVMALILIVFLSLQNLISIIYLVISLTCWKGQFFEKIYQSFLNRFFYFADIIITHIPIIAISAMFLTLPDYGNRLKILKYIIFSISIIQCIFFIILLIGLIISCKIQSDKDTIENSGNEDTIQNFFNDPQKKLMQISLIVFALFTIVSFIDSIVLYIKDKKQLFSFELISALIGGFVIFISIVFLVISQTCWKGTFVNKLIGNNIKRLVLFLISFIISISYITFELLHFVFAFDDIKKSKLHAFEISLTLICPLLQFISLIVFTVGFCIAHQNKLKNDLHSSSLINNNDLE